MSDLKTTGTPLELNCRRLLCPMPVIKVQDLLKTLPIGTEVIAYCTDPGVKNDIPAWCRIHGHTVISIEDINTEIVIRLIKGETP